MKRKIYSLILALGFMTVSSCDMDLLENPNEVTVETASPNLILNRIQRDFAIFYNTTSNFGMQLTRIINQPNALYQNAYVAVTFNPIWTNGYSNILNDIKFLETLQADQDAPLTRHLGIARVIRAYILMTMADSFGDVPWSEALDPNNFNPVVDPGAAIYAQALADLNQARADFAEPFGTPSDFFYGGNAERWIKLINTLELKYHLSLSLVETAASTSGINQLISADNFIGPDEDFVFRYGTSINDPDSRHPRFADNYTAGAAGYHSTWYMWHLTEAKGFDDPRARMYLYRQVTENTTDADELRCIGEFPPAHYQIGGWPFCLPGERGYWGRDHLNNEGIPPDGLKRTTWGLYPAGGRYDDDSAQPINDPTLGAQGAGLQPIMPAAFVDFMLAEAALRLGTTGDAKAYLQSAIQKHMDFVRDFAMNSPEAGAINAFEAEEEYDWDEEVEDYIAYVSGQYDAASNKMNVIGREYWLSLFGNGIEAYNLYRRTGQPDNMQPGLLENSGPFPRSFLYPNVYLATNSNASQKPGGLGQRVFWDNNPEGNSFIY